MVGSICTWIFRVGAGSPALSAEARVARFTTRRTRRGGIWTSSSTGRCCSSRTARDLSDVRGAQGRHAVGSGGLRVHVVVRGLRAGAGQGDADRQRGQALGRARHALVADRRTLRVARGGGAGFV